MVLRSDALVLCGLLAEWRARIANVTVPKLRVPPALTSAHHHIHLDRRGQRQRRHADRGAGRVGRRTCPFRCRSTSPPRSACSPWRGWRRRCRRCAPGGCPRSRRSPPCRPRAGRGAVAYRLAARLRLRETVTVGLAAPFTCLVASLGASRKLASCPGKIGDEYCCRA
jgi:hypothetical protein